MLFDEMVRRLGYEIDWATIGTEEFLHAVVAAYEGQDYRKLREILQNASTGSFMTTFRKKRYMRVVNLTIFGPDEIRAFEQTVAYFSPKSSGSTGRPCLSVLRVFSKMEAVINIADVRNFHNGVTFPVQNYCPERHD